MTPARLLFVLGLGAAAAAAQPVSPGHLAGAWLLNAYLSDGPAQIAQAIRYDTGEAGDEFVGRGRQNGPRRAEPERTPPEDRKDPLAPEDRKRLKELTDAVQFASTTLTISQTGTEVIIATTTRGTQTLHTTGQAEQYPLDAGVIKRTAAWEGPVLAVTYDLDAGGTLRYTYFVVPTTQQLLVRVGYERSDGQAGPFEIRLVYDRRHDR